jgi:endonuclease/exonuclease/phosphatase family metal-dependent hydrolase
VSEVATANTARVIQDLKADILTVIEAESRPTLQMFSNAMLPAVGYRAYEQVMLVEGNDTRGIDVGFLARDDVTLLEIRTHVFDTDRTGQIFSRDCCEYHVTVGSGQRMAILVNHFKSKGYSEGRDPLGAKKRRRQASRLAQIYRGLLAEGIDHIAITGDLNDDPSSPALKPLLDGSGLTDIGEFPAFDWNHRRGTYGSGGTKDKIDYILLSPAMYARVTGGGISRLGVWRGPRTGDPWPILPTLTVARGFGDITATSQAARLLVTARMILGLGIRVFSGTVQVARQQQPNEPERQTPNAS